MQQPLLEEIPIRIDENGRMRVGNTRVLLNLVIYSFWQGASPETIIDQYSSLSLEDVYLAIGYYLRHREEIDAHIQREDEEAKKLQQEIEAKFPPRLTREMLEQRLAAKRQAEGQ
jgi:uncharacterized protein (DUF433 family)